MCDQVLCLVVHHSLLAITLRSIHLLRCHFYRSQTKLRIGNVSQACVKNSVHGGVYTPWADIPPGKHSLLGRHPPAQTSPWADIPLADTPQQMATAADGMHPTGMHYYTKVVAEAVLFPYHYIIWLLICNSKIRNFSFAALTVLLQGGRA